MDLTPTVPRSVREKHLGLVQLARTTDKAKASVHGNLGEYEYPSALDERLFEFLGMKSADFLDFIERAKSDAEIEAYTRGFVDKKPPEEVVSFNERWMASAAEDTPGVLIAAIARTDDVVQLEQTVSRCIGLEVDRITLFKKALADETPAPLRMHFIPFQGSPVASGMHGTHVPGMATTLALNSYSADTSVDHLKDSGISYDAAHYYNTAIDEGRSVVTYVTSAEDATAIEDRFRDCGFVKIRRFPSA